MSLSDLGGISRITDHPFPKRSPARDVGQENVTRGTEEHHFAEVSVGSQNGRIQGGDSQGFRPLVEDFKAVWDRTEFGI